MAFINIFRCINDIKYINWMRVGNIVNLKKALLSTFLAGYLILFIAYFVIILLVYRKKLPSSEVWFILLWNISFCGVVWIGILASLISYLKKRIGFFTSLWVGHKLKQIKLMKNFFFNKVYR